MAKLPEEVVEALESGDTKCVLTTVNEDGSLNLVPVGSIRMIGDEKLAYACCFDGRTTGNLKEGRKKVAIAIWKPRLEGFQVKGTLQDMHDSGELFDEFSSSVNPMMETMGIDCTVQHVAVIKVTEVYALTLPIAGERMA
jgi:predicted pyridoxine 5'-phosphate oxidase superfamily flavin-nucleotide-binding protein